MKIGINALSINPKPTGGGTTYILELVKHLSQIDQRNDYFLFIRSDSKQYFDLYGPNFRFISIPVLPLFSIAFRVLVEQFIVPLFAWRYGLNVLFWPGETLPYWKPCASIMVIQSLLHFHRHEVSSLTYIDPKLQARARIWYYKYFTPRSALRADRIVTVSENAKREIAEFLNINDSKISVIYHGVKSHFNEIGISKEKSTEDTISTFNLNPGYLLYVGAVSPHKNIEKLLATLSVLRDHHSITCQLVLAGPDYSGYASHLRSIADRLGISEQIVFLGYVPYEKLPFLYHRAKVFVLLSLCESFGLPILEAMACGCPVVCSNVSSLPEIAGDAAVLVDPNDPLSVADAIKVLLEDEEYRRSIIAMGKKRVMNFSWDQAASQTIEVIEGVVKNHCSVIEK